MELTMKVDLTVHQIAEAFSELSDDGMAQVIIEVAEIAKGWENTNHDQWHAVGRHLRTCSCSTEEAVHLIFQIARGIDPNLEEP
jgi:hypothetical protein